MQIDLLNSLIPAVVVAVVVIALEDWAFLKARTKHQRAAIMAVAVFVLVLVLNFPLAAL